MRKRDILLPIIIILIVSAAILLALTAWTDFSPETATFLYSLLIFGIAAGLFVTWFQKHAYILVDELDTAVIFHKSRNKFAYFIDSELDETAPELKERPFNLHNKRFLNKSLHKRDKYHHFINPFTEKVSGRIHKKSHSTSGTLEDLRTKEGIPVSISYNIGAKIDLTKIKPGLEFKMARALPVAASNMVKGRAIHALRYIVENKSVTDLYGPDAIKALEKEMREDLTERSKIMGVKPLSPNDMKLGPVRIPYDVQKAIEAAHERELQTKTAVKALEQIKNAIDKYDDKDLERLAELERLRILDQHGDTLSYEMFNLRKSIEQDQIKARRTVRETNSPN
jgi:hypothetical protein